MAYMVEISKNVFVPEDPSKRCTNYPTDVFQSYKECDNRFMSNLLSRVSPDLVPIWLTDDMDNVSSLLVDTNGEFGRCKCCPTRFIFTQVSSMTCLTEVKVRNAFCLVSQRTQKPSFLTNMQVKPLTSTSPFHPR